jgi:GntR family transcriptional regulator / MocR family aminotransferase
MPKLVATSLLVRLDPQDAAGLQKQIYAGLRRAILDGVVKPGARLPSSRELARDLGVSRTTSLLALEQLRAEGYLTARRGSGTFVARELPDDLPGPHAARPPTTAKHPPLSKRGAALAATPPSAWRIPGPPRAFRIGIPGLDLFPVRLWSQLVNRRSRSVTPADLDYGSSAGLRALREAIADHVRVSRGARCDAGQVVVVAGAQQALDLVARVLLDPGDRVWMEEPGYPAARSAFVAAGARLVPVPVDEQGLQVRTGAKRSPDARLAFVTPSHQFPLGVPMSLARRLALLRWAAGAGAWVVEDDYDSEFRYGARPLPCLHGLDADGRVIYVGSFSKTLFPALRLGFLVVPGDLQGRLIGARRAADLHPPLLTQAVLADFIAAGHFASHLRRMRAAYRERLGALEDAARRHGRGALALRPVRTGLHAVADLRGADAEAVAHEAMARGVEVTPLSSYHAGRRGSTNALVLGFASARPESLAEGVKRLVAAIEAAARPLRPPVARSLEGVAVP